MAAEAVRAAVFFENDEQRKLAEEALSAGPGEATVFNGVVEGWGAPAKLEELSGRGMVVEPLGEEPAPSPAADQDAPAPKLLADFEQQADLEGPDAGGEAVYHIDLEGPITKEQRLELDALGVDIYMFEPPNRYRTFLTGEQLEKVRALAYVDEVTPYGFGESVTASLLDTVSKAQEGGDTSLQSEEGADEVQTFDCLLHRGSDLKKVCALIDEDKGAKVIDTSNLRVRFQAPVHAPFLAGLAALPEVRKLAPFNPPKLL